MVDRGGPGGVGGGIEVGGSGAHDDPARWGPRLARLLERSCELCRELNGLSEGQGAAVRSGDTDALLVILAQRQALIDELGGLNEQVEPFRRRWDFYVGRLPGAERSRLEMTVGQLSALIGQISERDDADRAALESQRATLAAEINSVRCAKGAVAAYGGRALDEGAMYQDRRG